MSEASAWCPPCMTPCFDTGSENKIAQLRAEMIDLGEIAKHGKVYIKTQNTTAARTPSPNTNHVVLGTLNTEGGVNEILSYLQEWASGCRWGRGGPRTEPGRQALVLRAGSASWDVISLDRLRSHRPRLPAGPCSRRGSQTVSLGHAPIPDDFLGLDLDAQADHLVTPTGAVAPFALPRPSCLVINEHRRQLGLSLAPDREHPIRTSRRPVFSGPTSPSPQSRPIHTPHRLVSRRRALPSTASA